MRLVLPAIGATLLAILGTVPAAAQQPSEAFPPPPPPPLIAPGDWNGDTDLPDIRSLHAVRRVSLQQESTPSRPPRQQSAQDGFVPVSQLPPEEQLPAAPMLVSAYVVVVLALFLYLLSLSRRLGHVKQEIARLDAEVKRSGRA